MDNNLQVAYARQFDDSLGFRDTISYRRFQRQILQLNFNNTISTRYFVAHQDYAQVYPGDPINVLGTVRVHLK